jgi:glutathionyl-hydroquinone reductase
VATAGQFPEEMSAAGEFARQEDAFRQQVSTDGSTPYAAEAGRYHLYVSLACPWAHRTVIARHLKDLTPAIGLTVVDPVRDAAGIRSTVSNFSARRITPASRVIADAPRCRCCGIGSRGAL